MSYTLSAKVIGDKELKEAFSKAPKQVAKYMGDAIHKTAYETQGNAVRKAPHDHGQLQQSISVKGPVMTADNIFATVSTDLKYGRYQEEGTGIYGPKGTPIRPKNGKVLAWKKNGKWIFAREVSGVKPKWYMKQAREEARPLLTNHMQDALGKILHFLAT